MSQSVLLHEEGRRKREGEDIYENSVNVIQETHFGVMIA